MIARVGESFAEGGVPAVTASVGVAAVDHQTAVLDEVMARADAATYRGRTGFAAADPQTPLSSVAIAG